VRERDSERENESERERESGTRKSYSMTFQNAALEDAVMKRVVETK
jgi:hypothetical protein